MLIQYAVFSSLVLYDLNGNIPIFPFDPATGRAGNLEYHYHPTVRVRELPGSLGFVISSYNDSDGRRLCCFETDQEDLSRNPDLLLDAVRMGLSSFGGRTLNHLEALDIAQKLQPEREEILLNPHPDMEMPVTKKYGPILLDQSRILTRSVS